MMLLDRLAMVISNAGMAIQMNKIAPPTVRFFTLSCEQTISVTAYQAE